MQYFFAQLIIILIFFQNLILAHCQVPCGIYNDASRIIEIKEDFETIRKAMIQINSLSKLADPQSNNQLNRWIVSKDHHAENIQKIVSEYFLTQRIKEGNIEYIEKVTLLQKLLVNAMKCKQTINLDYVETGLVLVESFSKIYFDEDGHNHLNTFPR